MDANPYSPPLTTSPSTAVHNREIADALFAAFASFGISHLSLLIATSILLHGRFVAFSIYDSAHLLFAAVSAMNSVTLFATVLMRRWTRRRWHPPSICAALALTLASVLYLVSIPGTERGAIDFSPLMSFCLVALIPVVAWLSLIHFSPRRLILATLPYALVIMTMVYAAVAD